jgi:hypothetical protein
MSRITDDQELRESIELYTKSKWDITLKGDQIDLCIIVMEQEKVSLFHDHIYPNRRTTKVDGKWIEKLNWDKTIDGFRAVAQRHGLAGMDEPVWTSDDTGRPIVCKVTVYKRAPNGTRDPYVGVARFSEFVQTKWVYENNKKTDRKEPQRQWVESPYNQLAIAAEKQAIRRGFQELFKTEEISIAPDSDDAPAIEGPPSAPAPASTPSPNPAKPPPQETAGVENADPKPKMEIPEGGFKFGAKFNQDTIVIARKKDDIWSLAFDNGRAAKIAADGTLIEMRNRSDERHGGLAWEEGTAFYDGSKITSVRRLKKELRIALELDSGFKVKLDRWGKEIGRKELPKEAVATGGEQPGDLEPKKEALRLLGEWCAKCNGAQRLSPKQAYKEFTGVIIEAGDEMSVDDYAVLRDELQAQLDKHESAA